MREKIREALDSRGFAFFGHHSCDATYGSPAYLALKIVKGTNHKYSLWTYFAGEWKSANAILGVDAIDWLPDAMEVFQDEQEAILAQGSYMKDNAEWYGDESYSLEAFFPKETS
jgi:hypothetical protein